MKTRTFLISIIVTVLFSCSTMVIAPTPIGMARPPVYRELLYECWGTVYHAVRSQCDATPLTTGSGFKIDPINASDQRILAISHEMLYDMWRLGILIEHEVDTTIDRRFRGKIAYGDSVWVESPRDSLGQYKYPNLNGWWYVQDTKNKRYKNSIDFLQTVGDRDLFNNNPRWNGKFEDLKIYARHDRT